MKSFMFVRGLLAIMLLLGLGALAGCGENEQTQSKPATVSKEDVKKEANVSGGKRSVEWCRFAN